MTAVRIPRARWLPALAALATAGAFAQAPPASEESPRQAFRVLPRWRSRFRRMRNRFRAIFRSVRAMSGSLLSVGFSFVNVQN